MPTSTPLQEACEMKIAITSQNLRTITGHAGKTRRFLIFANDDAGTLTQIERLDLPQSMSLHEYHGTEHPLFDVDVLITGGHGEHFAERLARYGVTVIATSESDPQSAAAAYLAGKTLPPPAPHRHVSHPAPSVSLKIDD
jgi:predicted Fe-Mo cluster-binding NifX family protein